MEHTYSPEFDMGGTTARIATSPTGKTYLHQLNQELSGDGVTVDVWRYRHVEPGPDLEALREALAELAVTMAETTNEQA